MGVSITKVGETSENNHVALVLYNARQPTSLSLAKRLHTPVSPFCARMQDKHLGDIPAYVFDILRLLSSDPSLPSLLDVGAQHRDRRTKLNRSEERLTSRGQAATNCSNVAPVPLHTGSHFLNLCSDG